MKEILRKIAERWFLSEPAFFSLYCQQQTEANYTMNCPMRCGLGKLEYNPNLLKGMPLEVTDMLMRIELIRIFLKHPYQRHPRGCSRMAMSMGSDTTIMDNYKIRHDQIRLTPPSFWKLESGQYYEWYCQKIQELIEDEGKEPARQNSSNAPDANGTQEKWSEEMQKSAQDNAATWEEDDMRCQEINELIEKTNHWGSIPGDMVQSIIASTKSKIDYRKIIQGFRASILSSHTRLTRMRPNRRTGFDNMGSMRKFGTRLLVAVDVSGSISDSTLRNFYGVINRFFKYGVAHIDCCQFDCELKEVAPMRKASMEIKIHGRGGTDFQPVFDYLETHNVYDGLIILTDGYAPHPTVSKDITAKILWVCENEDCYKQNQRWMNLLGRVCWMMLN